jgi:superfamily I DNA/RNA helicase
MGELAQWAEVLEPNGILRDGALAKLKDAGPAQITTTERLIEIFEPSAGDSLLRAYCGSYRDLLEWWRPRVKPDHSERVKYAVEVAARRGPAALLEAPKVVVGTIHSVKGGQADVVYLFPDLSRAGDAEYARGGTARDSIIRLFYVGATRAYERLCICQRETLSAISI